MTELLKYFDSAVERAEMSLRAALDVRERFLMEIYPLVFIDSTDHEMALKSGYYFVVTDERRSLEKFVFSASKAGVYVSDDETTVKLKEWDSSACLIACENDYPTKEDGYSIVESA